MSALDDDRAERQRVVGLMASHVTRIDRFEPSEDGATLTVTFLGGMYPCGVLDHVEIWRDAGHLKVLVVTGTRPSDGTFACRLAGVPRSTVVEIPEALRGLDPVDASQT